MKKSLIKNNLRTITKTRRRFLSILIMAFLGVGFYSGLVASSPDMLDSLDKYTDSSNLYDISVVSTLGLTDEDINAIKSIEGVDQVYGIKTKDTIVNFNEKESTCKVIEYNENINKPVLISGRMPENENECLLDSGYSYPEGAEKYIGKTITVQNEEVDENNNPIFTIKEFNIVGIVESPIYISSERGTTTIGDGKIGFYIYCQEGILNLDCFTEIGVKVAGAEDVVTNSDEYLGLVNPVIEKIEQIKEERQQARYDELVNEANKKIDEAQKEYDDKKAEVDSQLQDAEDKINEAKNQISNSEAELNSAEEDLNTQKQNLDNQFAEAEKQITDSENQINESIKAIGKETPELTAAKQQLQAKKNELSTNKTTAYNKIESGMQEIESAREEIEEAKAELEQNEQEYQNSKKEAEDKLNEAQVKIDDAKEEVAKIEKAKWYIQDRLDNTGYTNIFDAIETMSNISKIFPIIFYLVAVLISLTSMTRMIEEERVEIGTLKALGYKNGQIISKYMLYSFSACIIGGVLGMSICFYLLPSIVWKLYSMIYTIPEFYTTYRLSIGLVGILISFICIGGATLIVAYNELKETPSVLMRPKPPKNGKRVFMERIKIIWKRLNFSQKVTIRNIFRYKKRAIITIIGIAGCTGLMLAGFGIRDSVSDIPDFQFKDIFKYETSVTLSNTNGIEQITEYLSNNENIEDFSKIYATTGKVANENISYSVNIFVPEEIEGFDKVINLIDVENEQKLQLSNDGIIITDKLADKFEINVGDELTLIDSDDIEYKLEVSGITKNYVGHYIYMSKEYYEANMSSYKTNMIFVNTQNISEEQQKEISENLLNIEGVASVSIISGLIESVSDMLNTMNYVVLVLIVTSAMLAFVVLYNLANINIGERQREIATLKVLGFYDKEVDNYINKENIIFTVIGVILGLGFGVLLTNGIIESIEIDSLRFARNICVSSYIISAVTTITFSIIVNTVIHFVLKKINMIESLKSVE